MTLKARTREDSQSDVSDDAFDGTIVPGNGLVQHLGCQRTEPPPSFGNVSINDSTDVHFGDKNIYNGPVTIKQLVYSNLTDFDDKGRQLAAGRDNPTFVEDGSVDGVQNGGTASDAKQNDEPGQNTTLFRKGFIWLQNAPKQRPLEVAIFLLVILVSLLVLFLVLFLKDPSEKKSGLTPSDTNEQDTIDPMDYSPNLSAATQLMSKLHIFSRIEWLAQPPVQKGSPLPNPVPYVILHHTATENCSSHSQCVLHVRTIQMFHIESRGWWDIGYNFLVGGDGAAYEGRGWTTEGAHTLGFNSKSMGIAFIGTFVAEKPPKVQLIACQQLIRKGVDGGYIAKDYKLLTARQLHTTESPGLALFQEIQTWDHWAKEP